MATYAYKVQLKSDKYELLKGTVVSTDEGIQVGMVPASGQEYVERRNPETGDILWCNSDDYYEDSGQLPHPQGDGAWNSQVPTKN